jgi:hypothetical protein
MEHDHERRAIRSLPEKVQEEYFASSVRAVC